MPPKLRRPIPVRAPRRGAPPPSPPETARHPSQPSPQAGMAPPQSTNALREAFRQRGVNSSIAEILIGKGLRSLDQLTKLEEKDYESMGITTPFDKLEVRTLVEALKEEARVAQSARAPEQPTCRFEWAKNISAQLEQNQATQEELRSAVVPRAERILSDALYYCQNFQNAPSPADGSCRWQTGSPILAAASSFALSLKDLTMLWETLGEYFPDMFEMKSRTQSQLRAATSRLLTWVGNVIIDAPSDVPSDEFFSAIEQQSHLLHFLSEVDCIKESATHPLPWSSTEVLNALKKAIDSRVGASTELLHRFNNDSVEWQDSCAEVRKIEESKKHISKLENFRLLLEGFKTPSTKTFPSAHDVLAQRVDRCCAWLQRNPKHKLIHIRLYIESTIPAFHRTARQIVESALETLESQPHHGGTKLSYLVAATGKSSEYLPPDLLGRLETLKKAFLRKNFPTLCDEAAAPFGTIRDEIKKHRELLKQNKIWIPILKEKLSSHFTCMANLLKEFCQADPPHHPEVPLNNVETVTAFLHELLSDGHLCSLASGLSTVSWQNRIEERACDALKALKDFLFELPGCEDPATSVAVIQYLEYLRALSQLNGQSRDLLQESVQILIAGFFLMPPYRNNAFNFFEAVDQVLDRLGRVSVHLECFQKGTYGFKDLVQSRLDSVTSELLVISGGDTWRNAIRHVYWARELEIASLKRIQAKLSRPDWLNPFKFSLFTERITDLVQQLGIDEEDASASKNTDDTAAQIQSYLNVLQFGTIAGHESAREKIETETKRLTSTATESTSFVENYHKVGDCIDVLNHFLKDVRQAKQNQNSWGGESYNFKIKRYRTCESLVVQVIDNLKRWRAKDDFVGYVNSKCVIWRDSSFHLLGEGQLSHDLFSLLALPLANNFRVEAAREVKRLFDEYTEAKKVLVIYLESHSNEKRLPNAELFAFRLKLIRNYRSLSASRRKLLGQLRVSVPEDEVESLLIKIQTSFLGVSNRIQSLLLREPCHFKGYGQISAEYNIFMTLVFDEERVPLITPGIVKKHTKHWSDMLRQTSGSEDWKRFDSGYLALSQLAEELKKSRNQVMTAIENRLKMARENFLRCDKGDTECHNAVDDLARTLAQLRRRSVEAPCMKEVAQCRIGELIQKFLDDLGSRQSLGQLFIALKRISQPESDCSMELQGAARLVLIENERFFQGIAALLWKQRTRDKLKPAELARLTTAGSWKGIDKFSVSTLAPNELTCLESLVTRYAATLEALKQRHLTQSLFMGETLTTDLLRTNALAHLEEFLGAEDTNLGKTRYIAELLAHLAMVLMGSLSNGIIVEAEPFKAGSKDSEPTIDWILAHDAQILAICRVLSLDQHDTDTFLWTWSTESKTAQWTPNKRNHMAQILTGEGKSVTLTLTAAVAMILGVGVDIVCYSEDLTRRDEQTMRRFYDALCASSDIVQQPADGTINTRYCTFDEVCGQRLSGVGEKGRRLVRSGIQVPPTFAAALEAREQRLLLIDESDVFFSKSFYGQCYRGGFLLRDEEGSAQKPIEDMIRFLYLNTTPDEEVYQLHVKKILDTCDPAAKDLISLCLKELRDNASNYNLRPSSHVHSDSLRVGVRHQGSLEAGLAYPNETVFECMRICQSGGPISAEVNEQIGLDIPVAQFSYAEIPKRNYQAIIGVSGTLLDCEQKKPIHTPEELKKLRDELKIVGFSYIPSVFPDAKRDFQFGQHVVIHQTESKWAGSITNVIADCLRHPSRKPCLVFFKNESQLDRFLQLRPENARHHQLTEKVPKIHRAGFITAATQPGSVTLCTRFFGRGTDFFCPSPDVIVVCVKTFWSSHPSEEIQIRGRTARQGQKGEYRIHLAVPHLLIKFFPDFMYCNLQPGKDDKRTSIERIACSEEELWRALTEKVQAGHPALQRALATAQADKLSQKQAAREVRLAYAKKAEAASIELIQRISVASTATEQLRLLTRHVQGDRTTPTHYILLIDVSDSMEGLRWTSLREAVREVAAALKRRATRGNPIYCTLIHFATKAISLGTVNCLTGKIDLPEERGKECMGCSTNYSRAFAEAYKVMTSNPGHIVSLVLLTDGIPVSCEHEGLLREKMKSEHFRPREFRCVYFAKEPTDESVPPAILKFTAIHQQYCVPALACLAKGKLDIQQHVVAVTSPLHRH